MACNSDGRQDERESSGKTTSRPPALVVLKALGLEPLDDLLLPPSSRNHHMVVVRLDFHPLSLP